MLIHVQARHHKGSYYMYITDDQFSKRRFSSTAEYECYPRPVDKQNYNLDKINLVQLKAFCK